MLEVEAKLSNNFSEIIHLNNYVSSIFRTRPLKLFRAGGEVTKEKGKSLTVLRVHEQWLLESPNEHTFSLENLWRFWRGTLKGCSSSGAHKWDSSEPGHYENRAYHSVLVPRIYYYRLYIRSSVFFIIPIWLAMEGVSFNPYLFLHSILLGYISSISFSSSTFFYLETHNTYLH